MAANGADLAWEIWQGLPVQEPLGLLYTLSVESVRLLSTAQSALELGFEPLQRSLAPLGGQPSHCVPSPFDTFTGPACVCRSGLCVVCKKDKDCRNLNFPKGINKV